jgi:hypothetical protein
LRNSDSNGDEYADEHPDGDCYIYSHVNGDEHADEYADKHAHGNCDGHKYDDAYRDRNGNAGELHYDHVWFRHARKLLYGKHQHCGCDTGRPTPDRAND